MTPGEAQSPRATPSRGLEGAVASTRPWPWSTSSASSDAYKLSPDEKTLTLEGFSQIRYRAPPPSPTSFGGKIVPVPAPCQDGDRSPEAISIDTTASHDEEGIVPHRG